MRGIRSSGSVCSLLFLTLMAGLQTSLAATSDNDPSALDTASPSQAAPLSPELRGDIYMAHRSYAAAIRAYQSATVRSAILLNKIGVAYHHMFALDEARKYYQQALTLNPHYPPALNNLGAIYYSKKDFGRAEHIYKQALEYEADSVTILVNLGTVYFADRKYKQGTVVYKKALALSPTALHPAARQTLSENGMSHRDWGSDYHLAKMLAGCGKIDDALGYLSKALDSGFIQRKQLTKDKEFSPLLNTPAFQEVLSEHTGRR